jgi:hypothetical protein
VRSPLSPSPSPTSPPSFRPSTRSEALVFAGVTRCSLRARELGTSRLFRGLTLRACDSSSATHFPSTSQPSHRRIVASLAYLLGFNKLMRPDRFPANDDADKINVPLLLLPSQNEDMNVVSSPRTLPLTPLIPLTLAYFCHSNLASSCASLSIVRRIALLMTALLR